VSDHNAPQCTYVTFYDSSAALTFVDRMREGHGNIAIGAHSGLCAMEEGRPFGPAAVVAECLARLAASASMPAPNKNASILLTTELLRAAEATHTCPTAARLGCAPSSVDIDADLAALLQLQNAEGAFTVVTNVGASGKDSGAQFADAVTALRQLPRVASKSARVQLRLMLTAPPSDVSTRATTAGPAETARSSSSVPRSVAPRPSSTVHSREPVYQSAAPAERSQTVHVSRPATASVTVGGDASSTRIMAPQVRRGFSAQRKLHMTLAAAHQPVDALGSPSRPPRPASTQPPSALDLSAIPGPFESMSRPKSSAGLPLRQHHPPRPHTATLVGEALKAQHEAIADGGFVTLFEGIGDSTMTNFLDRNRQFVALNGSPAESLPSLNAVVGVGQGGGLFSQLLVHREISRAAQLDPAWHQYPGEERFRDGRESKEDGGVATAADDCGEEWDANVAANESRQEPDEIQLVVDPRRASAEHSTSCRTAGGPRSSREDHPHS
jgi:hypothetical protein